MQFLIDFFALKEKRNTVDPNLPGPMQKTVTDNDSKHTNRQKEKGKTK